MNATIWKFVLPIRDEFTVEMPAGARLLSVQMQHGEPALWAIVDPRQWREQRRFGFRGTGHANVPATGYLGTVQTHDGGLVFHLFELGR